MASASNPNIPPLWQGGCRLIYLTGSTASTDFPTSPSAFQLINNGVRNFFVTKLNAAGNGLLHSTHLGGGGCADLAGIVQCHPASLALELPRTFTLLDT